MKRVLTALVLIPVVLLVVFKAPVWIFALVVGLCGTLAAYEYLRLVQAPIQFLVVSLVFVALSFISTAAFRFPGATQLTQTVSDLLSCLVTLAPFLLLALALGQDDLSHALRITALSVFALVYTTLPMHALIEIRSIDFGMGWFFLIFLFAVVWSGDILAYYVGKTLGRHKLAPRISPGKTWEGAIASIVGASLVAVALTSFATQMQEWILGRIVLERIYDGRIPIAPAPIWITILAATLINIAAQVGDLAESLIKRAVGKKDSGAIFPGHGGVLDRIDALLFAAPLAAIIFPIIQPYFIRVPLPK